MGPDGALGWRLTASDGRVFDEARCPWPQVPADVVVRELTVAGEIYSGFHAYGWQRYTVADTGGRALSRGYQVIGLLGDWALVTDVDEVYGRREVRVLPVGALTYARELLRAGR